MRRPTVPVLASVLFLAVTVALASAHDLFVKMDSYFLSPNTPVEIPIVNGTFALSENSIAVDRVASVSIVHDGRSHELDTDSWTAEGDTTFYSLQTGDPGTYVFGASTLPRDLGLDAPDFNEYLAHDGALDVLVQRALDRELDTSVWERYSKHVKAVFQVGSERSGGIDVVLGHPAELVPVTNPYGISAGDEMVVRALVDGEPVSNQLVLAGGEGANGPFEERSGRTGSDGMVSFEIDRPGVWYIKFINMVKTDAEGVYYESKWATLTFEIR